MYIALVLVALVLVVLVLHSTGIHTVALVLVALVHSTGINILVLHSTGTTKTEHFGPPMGSEHTHGAPVVTRDKCAL